MLGRTSASYVTSVGITRRKELRTLLLCTYNYSLLSVHSLTLMLHACRERETYPTTISSSSMSNVLAHVSSHTYLMHKQELIEGLNNSIKRSHSEDAYPCDITMISTECSYCLPYFVPT